jgi:hypothetical protein
VAEESVVVEDDLGVEREEAPVGLDGERVDLRELALLLS